MGVRFDGRMTAAGVEIYITPSIIAPVANFIATPTTITAGSTVTFTDTSTNSPTSWLWDFGDGTTSTLKNPTHVYNGAMKYTVSLSVSNGAGSNTKTVPNMITSNLSGNVVANPASPVTFSFAGGPQNIAFGDNKFIAIGNTGSGASQTILYSSNGANWSTPGILYSVGNSTYAKSVAYGNGHFVADHYNDYWTYYSIDGVNWSSQRVNAAVGLASSVIKAANGVYLNFSSGSQIGYSTDMVNWTSSNTSKNGGEYLPAVSKWVTISGSTTSYSTTNGASWVAGPTLTASVSFIGGSASNGSNLAVFTSNSAASNFTVTNGTTWNTYAAPFACTSICYGYDRFVALDSSRHLYWSTDGINWTQFATIPGTPVATSVAYGNGKYIVVSTSSTASWTIT